MQRLVSRAATAAAFARSSFLRPSALHRPSLLSSLRAAPLVPSRSAFTYPSSRSLGELVKLPLLVQHEREDIVQIWKSHHALSHNQAVAADALTAAEYDTFSARASKAPLFVLPVYQLATPLPEAPAPYTFDVDAGCEVMLLNVQQSSLLLTSLEEYKTRGAGNATPYAVITFYPDLAASKDLVLVRLEMLDVQVTLPQVQQLWSLIRKYYMGSEADFDQFPMPFNRKPNPSVDFDALLAECAQHVRTLQVANDAAPTQEEEVKAAEFVTDDKPKK